MRVLVGCLMQESNTFSPIRSDRSSFQNGCLLFGAESLTELVGKGTEVSGFLAVARQEAVQLIPTVTAWASSAGPMVAVDFHWLVDRLVEAAQAAGPVDGCLLALHGAWVSEDQDDADGYVLARLRGIVGRTIPIAATLDLHANVTRRMVASADLLVGYQTYPHVDMLQTGMRAARLLFRTIRGEIRPVLGYRKVPMLVPPEYAQTIDGPMADLQTRARAAEQRPACLAVSLFPVQPWLDVPELGLAVVAVGDGDLAAAQQEASGLATRAWGRRREFVVPLVPPRQAVARALATPTGLVLLVDSADGTSSGAPGDSTALLEALLAAQPARPVFLTVVDPEAARRAATAGPGAQLDLLIGGKLDPQRHRPVAVSGTVQTVASGRFTFTGGIGSGLTADMGQTAVLEIGQIRVVLMEKAVPCYDPALYRSVGLEPGQAHVVVVKSPTNFRWTYRDLARDAIYVDGPGASTPRLESLRYERAPRPLFPLDDWDGELPETEE
ncbi:MAG: M81 family metallopeptidase [Chloroflexi bacterium]|nr:M81 family metallopeptidase [Chloroflexota bacterium]